MTPATFRLLPIDDAYQIMPVIQGAFDPDYGEAWSLEHVQGALTMPRTFLLGCESHGVVVGFALVRTLFDESELLLVAVDPQHRGAGLGRCLVSEAAKVARTDGAKRLFLEVRTNNKAIKFYRHLQFTTIGRRPDYYRRNDGTRVDAQTMVIDINSIIHL